MERSGVLPTTQFDYRKGLQSALESGQAAKIVQFDFNPAFDRVNHGGMITGGLIRKRVLLMTSPRGIALNKLTHANLMPQL